MSPASGFHDPAVKPVRFWPWTNQGFYARFRRWLRAGGYGESALSTYGVAARLALGWLDKEYTLIDPDADLERVRDYVRSHYDSPGTRRSYLKGLAKLAEFLRHCQGRRPPLKPVDWDRYLGPLPDWLADDVRAYVAHRSRAWLPEERIRLTNILLGTVTRFLCRAAAGGRLNTIADLTPELWFDYLDAGWRPASAQLPSTPSWATCRASSSS